MTKTCSAKLHQPYLRWLFHLMVTNLHTVWGPRVLSRQGVWSWEPMLWLSSCCCGRKVPTGNQLTTPQNTQEQCSGPASTWNQANLFIIFKQEMQQVIKFPDGSYTSNIFLLRMQINAKNVNILIGHFFNNSPNIWRAFFVLATSTPWDRALG